MIPKQERPITEVLGNLVDQVTTLVRTESHLARAEISEKVQRLAAHGVMFAVGVALLLPGVMIVLQAVVAILVREGVPLYLSALLVGGGVLLVGAILMVVGINRLKAVTLVPNKTLRQIHRDIAMAKEVRHEHDQRAA